MHTDYSAIRSRIPEEPSWFDEFAVPRYGPFRPSAMGNIYAREAVLVLAACQGCGRHFRLAMSLPCHKSDPDLATAICNRSLHYGDPPNIGCCGPGPTMGVVELEVLEYWWRVGGGQWTREASFEAGVVSMPDDPRYETYFDRDRNPEYGFVFRGHTARTKRREVRRAIGRIVGSLSGSDPGSDRCRAAFRLARASLCKEVPPTR